MLRQRKEHGKDLKDGVLPSFNKCMCESCLMAKMILQSFTRKGSIVSDLKTPIHVHVCGNEFKCKAGFRYSKTFTNDSSRYDDIYKMK